MSLLVNTIIPTDLNYLSTKYTVIVECVQHLNIRMISNFGRILVVLQRIQFDYYIKINIKLNSRSKNASTCSMKIHKVLQRSYS